MRIQTNFKDYYDGVQALGHDETLVYQRYRKSHDVTLNTLSKNDNEQIRWARKLVGLAPNDDLPDGKFERIIIGFCGELYNMLRRREYGMVDGAYKEISRRCFFDTNGFKKAYPKEDEGSWFHSWHGRDTNYPELGHYDSDDDFFVEIKAPVFAVECGRRHGEDTLTINPCLKDFDFYRVKSDFQAYQELEMYLGNQLVSTGPDPLPLTDIEKVITHGFDPKMGFRKRKKG